MKIEKVDKWLDDKYGISYTELQKIKEYLLHKIERLEHQIEICDDINRIAINRKNMYHDRIDEAIEYIEKETKELYSKNRCCKYLGEIMQLEYVLNILRGEDNE